jgi:hypothetical protein
VSPEQGRVVDGVVWHGNGGAPGEVVVIPSDQGGRNAPGWAGDGPRMGRELGQQGNFHGKI